MNKSPFELRYELLEFARDSLTSEYYAKVEERKIQGSFGKSIDIVPYPTKEQVFALAEEYKNFIERK
jgi:hypothetical protein